MRSKVVLISGGMVLVAALVAAAFLVGKGSVDTHSDELAELHAQVESTEADLSVAEGETAVAKEEVAEVEEELASERSFKGEGEAKQVAEQEYATDYPWEAAGEAGNFIFKPVGWQQDGEKWILTVEAKNVSHEPLMPFCGGAESVVVDAEDNNYTGESVLGEATANCSGDLQPGTTATYEAEFNLPSKASPVAVAIYGEYEQQEEAKLWELPH